MKADKHSAAKILADMLSSRMLGQFERGHLTPTCWDRDGLLWLQDYMRNEKDWSLCMWTVHFIRLNEQELKKGTGPLNFNLRADRLEKEPNDD